ncbi:MAG: PAS domain S-box protein [Methylococcus sp.]|nr:PAS domain S-box protein [Methylococcus sp.]
MPNKAGNSSDAEIAGRRSLLRDLRYSLLGLVGAFSLAAAAGVYAYFYRESKLEIRENLSVYSKYLERTLELPLWDMEVELVNSICEAFSTHENVALLVVRDDQGQAVCEVHSGRQLTAAPQAVAVTHNGRPVGAFELGLDQSYFDRKNLQLLAYSLTSIASTLLAIGLLLRLILRRLLQKPFESLLQRIEQFGSGTYHADIPATERREPAFILSRLNIMAAQVQVREWSLRELNRQLSGEINERKQAEAVARDSERKYRNIFENAPFGIFRSSWDGTLQDVNPHGASILGYDSPEEMQAAVPNTIQLYARPDDRSVLMQRIRDSSTVINFETSFLRKDRSPVPVALTIRHVEASDLEDTHLETFVEDISERLEAEARNRQLAAIVEWSDDGIIGKTLDGIVTSWNRAAEAIYGYSAAEAIGQPLDKLVAAGKEQEIKHILERIGQGEHVSHYETVRRRKDGGEIHVALTVSPLRDKEGRLVGASTIVRDVTERKRAQDELQRLALNLQQRVQEELAKNREKDHLLIQQSRLAAMGEMVHNIAHQWRQPLNALSIIIANIKDDYVYKALDENTLNQAVEKSYKLIQQMSTTIDDFRDFFRPDREAAEFDVAVAVENALFIVDDALRNNRIELRKELPRGLIAFGYANQFSQAVLNIVANAKEAIQEHRPREPKISVELGPSNDDLVLSITDNAGGIAQEILPRIFDPYFSTKEQGSGIGLYMAKIIIERNMKGSIQAGNQTDGAVFTLTIPRLRRHDA